MNDDDVETGFLSPDDLAWLERVVEEVCPGQRQEGSDRAALVAAAAVELYQSGLMDQQVMVERLRGL